MSRVRATLISLIALGAAGLPGCRTGSEFDEAPAQTAATTENLPTYAAIAQRYNDRAAMLNRVWSRCSAAFKFEDERGKQRSEQGEGHLQIVQPDRFALSVGKLGETLLWVGGDRDRYWLIERIEDKRAFVGRYSELTPEKAARIGLPVYPSEMVHMLGVAPLPIDAEATVHRFRDGDLVVSVPVAGSDDARWFYKIDELTAEPRAVRLKVGKKIVLDAELSDYIRVEVEGMAVGPRIAKRALLSHRPSGASMNIQLDDTVSDGAGRLRGTAFDFEALVDALGPLEVIDVDASQPSDGGAPGYR